MRKLLTSIADAPYRLMAAVSTLTLAASQAHAEGIGKKAEGVVEQLQGVGGLITTGAYIGGIVMSGAGLMKLKQAADTQGTQVKYADGLWRLAVGAGLVALPTVTGVGKDTLFGTSSGDNGPDVMRLNIR